MRKKTAFSTLLAILSLLGGEIEAQDHVYDVVVIGAGMAGIAAAHELVHQGYDVVVLEGRNRIGGRIHTVTLNETPIDLGATWIKGTQGNPIYALASKYNIKTIPYDDDSIDVFSTEGQLLNADQMKSLNQIEDALYDMIEKQQEEQEEDMPLYGALNPWISSLPSTYQLWARYKLSSEIELDYAADAQDLSLYYFDSDSEFGGNDLIVPGGYKQLIDVLAQDLNILTDQKVVAIDYDDQHVTVKTTRGMFNANYAICTIPLGVLKSDRTPLFNPPLPITKQKAMSNLKMSILHKTVLYFPFPFWNDQTNIIGYIPQEKGHWVEYVNLYKFTKAPILIGFNASEYADSFKSLTDSEIKDQMMEVLRTMYGSHIPEPISYVTSHWGEDPFSFGSYSHLPVGASPKDYAEMAKPVGNLLFAGEATSLEYFGTVMGAYLSGIREAKRVLQSKNMKR